MKGLSMTRSAWMRGWLVALVFGAGWLAGSVRLGGLSAGATPSGAVDNASGSATGTESGSTMDGRFEALSARAAMLLRQPPKAGDPPPPLVPDGAPPPEPPEPGPVPVGPEHKRFQDEVGVWDAKVKSFQGPDKPPVESVAVESNNLLTGGTWLATRHEATMKDKPFAGAGLLGWSAERNRYISVWVDSWSDRISFMEGEWDPKTNRLVMFAEMVNPTNNETMRERHVTTYPAPGKRLYLIELEVEKDRFEPMLEVEYTKRK
jgi:hypothetical protein